MLITANIFKASYFSELFKCSASFILTTRGGRLGCCPHVLARKTEAQGHMLRDQGCG